MAGRPKPPIAASSTTADDDHDGLRILSRSPHPYHRQHFELLEPSDRLVYRATLAAAAQKSGAVSDHLPASFVKDSSPASDSGTEADDEHVLKGLPAPRARLHKGLRGRNESFSGSSTPLLSPALLEEEGRKLPPHLKREAFESDKKIENARRRKELLRRTTELLLLACQGGMLQSNSDVQPFLQLYYKGMLCYPTAT
jgi:hypothetical protein